MPHWILNSNYADRGSIAKRRGITVVVLKLVDPPVGNHYWVPHRTPPPPHLAFVGMAALVLVGRRNLDLSPMGPGSLFGWNKNIRLSIQSSLHKSK